MKMVSGEAWYIGVSTDMIPNIDIKLEEVISI